MFLGRITGSVISTQKVDAMVGQKLLIVEPLRVDEENKDCLRPTGRSFVVVDTVGAGEGEVVLCVQGSKEAMREANTIDSNELRPSRFRDI